MGLDGKDEHSGPFLNSLTKELMYLLYLHEINE